MNYNMDIIEYLARKKSFHYTEYKNELRRAAVSIADNNVQQLYMAAAAARHHNAYCESLQEVRDWITQQQESDK